MRSQAPSVGRPTNSAAGLTKLADKLTVVTAVCSLVLSIYLLGASLLRLKDVSTASAPPLPHFLAEGDTLGFLPATAFDKKPLTVVLVIREDCQFCQSSIPFYQRLAAELKRNGGVQLTVVSSDPIDTLRRYLHASSIEADEVFSLRLERSGMRGTPTLVLCDSRGRIRRVWVGKLDAAGEQEVVVSILSSVTPAA